MTQPEGLRPNCCNLSSTVLGSTVGAGPEHADNHTSVKSHTPNSPRGMQTSVSSRGGPRLVSRVYAA